MQMPTNMAASDIIDTYVYRLSPFLCSSRAG